MAEFYDGRRMSYRASLDYRTGPFFTGSVEYSEDDVELDGGDFKTRIARVRTKFSFTPNLSWNTFVQWDNQSNQLGLNSRVRWIPSPGNELFLVFNETIHEDGDEFASLAEQIAFKIAYTIRF